MATQRDYQLVLLGASGFTGGLCAEYLSKHLPPETRWAIAGRNRLKLEQLRQRLASPVNAAIPEVLYADVDDADSLSAMAAATQVVITTVGPYVLYGEGVVKACVENGSHYCDLTGEPEFVNNIIARYHDSAEANGVAIVNCCGFDSIPHDAGVLFTVRALEQAQGGVLDMPVTIEGGVSADASFSGGTWQSAITAFARVAENKAAMNRAKPVLKAHYPRRVSATSLRPRKGEDFAGWMIPLPTIDPYVVSRTARALDAYGPAFRYGHFVISPSLLKGIAGMAGVAGLVLGAQIKPIRTRLLRSRPSGQGPSAAKRAKSWFRVRFVGTAGNHRVICDVSGGDPGYTETAKMLAETAMTLALDPGYPKRSGVITPMMALEDRLIERLQAAGMTFECVHSQ